ncbi:MAG: anti-sigma regulatory factor [Actinobacteria bacterium]|nr:anti-sigma regulatory factor [Actinomycetota bacterium]
MADEICVQIKSERDIVAARQEGRKLAAQVGFSGVDLTLIATSISEMARNIAVYAGEGEIVLDAIQNDSKRGIMVIARDEGPGIPDLERAMQDGFSTGKSLGLGLPGAKRLMDSFEVASQAGKGTSVTMKKWVR